MNRLARYFLVALVCAATLACTLPAFSRAILYPGNRDTINCGVIWLPVDSSPSTFVNGDEVRPFADGGAGELFGRLDAAYTKPADWTLENPISPPNPMSGMKYPKWDERHWRIILDEDTDLTAYQLLYLPASGNVNLEPRQREVLRKFVDSGGILWIDNSGINGPLNFQDTFFIQNFRFLAGGPTVSGEMGVNHPLISFPFWLNSIDINIVGKGGSSGSGFYCVPGFEMGTGTWGASQPTAFDVLLPVIGSGTRPTVAANAYGSGRIVTTSNFVGRGIFMHRNELDNISGMKFVYNLISWSSDWTTVAKNPRRSGSALDTVGGDGVVAYWSHNVSLPSLGSTSNNVPRYSSSAVTYKNLVFYSSGRSLYALGLIPAEDLDGDGYWNDGDQSTAGAPNNNQDVVFRWDCPDGSNLISSPTIVTMQNPVDPSRTVEAVAVLSDAGTLYILNAWPTDGDGVLEPSTVVFASFSFGETFSPPSPPLYSGGWFYAVSSNGRLYAYNPTIHEYCKAHSISDPSNWTWVNPQDANYTSAVGEFRGGPNFAYVSSDITQAVIGTVYWATARPGSGAKSLNDQIVSLPLFVTHDRARFSIQALPTNPTTIMMNHTGGARIANYPAPCWVEVRWTDAAGNKQYRRFDYGPGDNGSRNPAPNQMLVPFAIDRNMVVHANYTLDYSPTGLTPLPNSMSIKPDADDAENPDNPVSVITSSPAVGSQNTLLVNTILDYSKWGSYLPYAGGAVNAIRMDTEYQDGAPNNMVLANSSAWNYLLHSGKELQLPSQRRISVGGGYLWLPPVVETPEGYPVENLQPYGSPVTYNGKVYVAATGFANGQSKSVILCLREKSDFVIRILENSGYHSQNVARGNPKRLFNPTTNERYKVKIWQPNLVTHNPQERNPLMLATEVRARDGMIDYERGTITITDFNRLKVKTDTTGVGGYTLTPSLPVWVFLDDKEVPVDFRTWGPMRQVLESPLPNNVRNLLRPQGDSVDLSGWNNLLWYFVVPNNRTISSTPMVLGDKLYFLTDDGLLASINAENGLTQAERLDSDDTSNVQPVLNIPGFTSMTPGDRINNYLSASNGVILAVGKDGLFAASNLPTLVADGGRIVEIDGAGKLKWSMDKANLAVSIPQIRGDSPPRVGVPVNKPSKAKYTPKGDILVVNTGSNQVFIADKTGNVGIQEVFSNLISGRNDGYIRWMFDKFSDPYQILRSGQVNSISAPTDAEFWTEIEGGEFVYHCMIVDGGNHRVLDLVYRIDTASNECLNTVVDADTGFILPELRWATRSDKRYTIESMQKVYRDNLGDVQDVWIAASALQSINAVSDPELSQGAVLPIPYRERTGPDSWNYLVPNSGEIGALPPVAVGRVGLRFARVYGPPSDRYMFISDKSGVSKYNIDSGGTLTLAAQLTDSDYANRPETQGVPLAASFVQEVSLGNWLIVNSYVDGSFAGEIFEFSPNEPLPDAFKTICPTTSEDSYEINQPSSALRAF